MTPIPYLHDIADTRAGRVGANRSNIDSLDRVAAYLRANPGSTITADDGYRSILRPLPALEATSPRLIRSTTTGFVGRAVTSYEVAVSTILERDAGLFLGGAWLEGEDAYSHIHRRVKFLSPRARATSLAAIEKENDVALKDAVPVGTYLGWDDIRKLSQHPNITIGAHTHSHVHLPSMPWRIALGELIISRLILRARLGVAATDMSYPYGGYSARVARFARLAGYSSGYTTRAEGCGRYGIPRQPLESLL